MWPKHWMALSAGLAVVLAGCGGSDATGWGSAADEKSAGQSGPAAAVAEFLEAVRTGDDEKAARMLTETARTKTAEMNMEVAPPGSDTASFEVGQVEYLGENRDGARVASTWSDLDENSKRRSDQITWMLRREPQGWRIAGVAATIFEGEPPLLLNFEDPEEMLRKQRWVQEETRRRAKNGDFQARRKKNSEDSIRR